MNEKAMPFLAHLAELRRAILRSFLAFLAASSICLIFSSQLFRWLQKPLREILPPTWHFIATTPFETYAAYLKVALTFGLLFSSPLIFFFFWGFIRPGLKREERKGVVPIALFCGLLFLGGALFGYWVVFPPAFRFVVDILGGTDIVFFPKVSDYLSFSLRLLLAFGIIFELPLLLGILGRLGWVNAKQLSRSRKYVIIAIFLVAGILTPGPDVLSQVLMALPLLLLFEVGILLVRFFGKTPRALPSTPG